MSSSALTGTVLGIAGACLALLLFPPLFDKLAGWPAFVREFGSPTSPAITRLGYASLGCFFSVPVRLRASPEGLHVTGSYFPPWRRKSTVVVPWRHVSQRRAPRFFPATAFLVSGHSQYCLLAKRRVAARLDPYLAEGCAA